MSDPTPPTSLPPSLQPEASEVRVQTHPPIRGMRAMAIVRWALLIAVAAVAAATWWLTTIGAAPAPAGEARYYCPMHPQIRSAAPGTCPICFMNLEPIPEDEPSSDHADAGVPEPSEPSGPGLATVMLTLERRQTAGIATVAVQRREVAGRARWPAVVEPQEGARAEVRVRAEAFVERVAVRASGVRVRAGQPLAWVYSPDLLRAQEELLAAQRWRSAPTTREGQEPEMLGAVAAARQHLLLLGATPRDIEAVLETGRAERTIAVRAPIAGYVTRFNAVVGSYAMPDTLLYEVTDLSRVRVVASAFREELGALDAGTTARFEPRGGVPVSGLELELVEPGVAQDTRTARVRFVADNPALVLRPGDIGELVVEGALHEELVVPRDALIDSGTARYVFVERERGLFEPREVTAGSLDGESRVIRAGLAEGEVVVSRGAFVLDSESRLQAALAPARANGGIPAASAAPANEGGAP